MEEVVLTVPAVPAVPSVPSVPSIPAMSSVPSIPAVPVLPLLPLVPVQTSEMFLNEVKPQTHNPWTVSDFEVFLFYCCPQCEHRTKTTSRLLEHAFLSHPESQETIKSMQHRQGFHIRFIL